jgi:uncharacterized protein involved in exopolysaccharide biosynthesis
MNRIPENEIFLKDVWQEVYSKKWLIISVSCIFTFLAVVLAIKLPNMYKSSVTLVPNSESQGNLSSLAKNFGGIASMAGIGFGESSGPDQATIGIEILKSQHFIVKFVRRHELVIPLMASTSSNPVSFELIIDEDIYDLSTNTWRREVEPPKSAEPTDEEIYKKFVELFEVNQDPKTGFIYASIEFFSPSIAKDWLELLIKDINAELRLNDKVEAERSIKFLYETLNDVSNNSIKTTIYQLVEEQAKTLMLAEAREEYIFKTISPATMPEKKSKPMRVLIVIAGSIIGGFLSFIYVLIRYFLNNDS